MVSKANQCWSWESPFEGFFWVLFPCHVCAIYIFMHIYLHASRWFCGVFTYLSWLSGQCRGVPLNSFGFYQDQLFRTRPIGGASSSLYGDVVHMKASNKDLSSMICLGRGFGPNLRPSQTCWSLMPTESSHGPIQDGLEKTIFFELVEGQNGGKTCRRFEEFRSLHCSRNLGPHFQEQIRGLCSENDRNKTLTCPKSAQDTTKGSTITTLIQASCLQWVRQLWVTSTTSHSHSTACEYFEVHLCDLGAVTWFAPMESWHLCQKKERS